MVNVCGAHTQVIKQTIMNFKIITKRTSYTQKYIPYTHISQIIRAIYTEIEEEI